MKKFMDQVKATAFDMYRKSYGMDTLNRVLLLWCAVVLILGTLFRSLVLKVLAGALMLGFVFRYFSTDKQKRAAENRKVEHSAVYGKAVWDNRKTHRVFMCPSCGAISRVPKGHGKVVITCPKCRTEYQARS